VVDFINIEDIVVNRTSRQRTDVDVDIEEMMASIEQLTPHLPETGGLINPIVIRRDTNELVAGERRYLAHKRLGRNRIAYNYLDTFDPVVVKILEFEENVKRVDIPWQNRAAACLEMHELLEARAKEEGKDWTRSETARRLSLSNQHISKLLDVGEELRKNPDVAKAASLSTAYNTISRREERAFDDALADIEANIIISGNKQTDAPIPALKFALTDLPISVEDIATKMPLSAPPTIRQEPIAPMSWKPAAHDLVCGDFNEWASTYSGPKFNFIHLDFPYNAGAGKSSSQINASGDHKAYDDDDLIFEALCQTVLDSMSNVVADSCHIMCWYQSGQWDVVHDTFQMYAKDYDLTVFKTPLIWFKSDGSGVISDPARRPRHIYETALMMSRGDRKIVKAVGDVYGSPVTRQIHPAEKPVPMLSHFFQMFVGPTTRFLDPTAGSGTSLRAAEAAGAESVFGLERDPEFHKHAVAELDLFRKKRALEKLINSKKETRNASTEDNGTGPGPTGTGLDLGPGAGELGGQSEAG
jgi:ParB-like chromosome segregation protein Spo0J/DNA modification methylase